MAPLLFHERSNMSKRLKKFDKKVAKLHYDLSRLMDERRDLKLDKNTMVALELLMGNAAASLCGILEITDEEIGKRNKKKRLKNQEDIIF